MIEGGSRWGYDPIWITMNKSGEFFSRLAPQIS